MPLEPYEQRVINVRMPSNYVDKPGLISQNGAVSMGSASAAHGYFDKSPKTSKLLIANPTGETIIIHAGTHVGSVIPTHLNPSDLLIVGTICMMRDRSWLDFPDTDANTLKPTSSVSAIRLVPPDDTNSAPKWRLQPENDPNRDLSESQQKRISEYIFDAAIGGPDKPSIFSSVHNLGRANSQWESH
jgi:hypothetical protein